MRVSGRDVGTAGRGSRMKVLRAIGIAVVCLLVIAGAVILGARWIYGPLGPFPGPGLSGPVVEGPVEDWSFVDAVKVIQVETRPDAPYSVDTWVTRIGDGIYVFAGSEKSPWVQNIIQDPLVRIRIDGRIYPLRAVGIADLQVKRVFLEAMKAKYEHDFGFDRELYERGRETGEFVLFRMEPR
jgi:hypothetical protein